MPRNKEETFIIHNTDFNHFTSEKSFHGVGVMINFSLSSYLTIATYRFGLDCPIGFEEKMLTHDNPQSLWSGIRRNGNVNG